MSWASGEYQYRLIQEKENIGEKNKLSIWSDPFVDSVPPMLVLSQSTEGQSSCEQREASFVSPSIKYLFLTAASEETHVN